MFGVFLGVDITRASYVANKNRQVKTRTDTSDSRKLGFVFFRIRIYLFHSAVSGWTLENFLVSFFKLYFYLKYYITLFFSNSKAKKARRKK